jgi:tRNA pseudouridine55 synthase
VLPLVVGRATRLAQFLTASDKRYLAGVRLGVATTTWDREGEPVGEPIDPAGVTPAQIEAALERFRGPFLQTPPLYSAKKIAGVSAHRLARRGIAAELAPASVTVRTLTLVSVEGADVRLDVAASAGFYVRSLAHELGAALGCGAHLHSLRRTAAGSIGIDGALPLARLDDEPEAAAAHLQPMSTLLADWPVVRVTRQGEARVRNGSLISAAECDLWVGAEAGLGAGPDGGPDGGPGGGADVSVRVLDGTGDLIALAAWVGARGAGLAAGPLLHPRVVLV